MEFGVKYEGVHTDVMNNSEKVSGRLPSSLALSDRTPKIATGEVWAREAGDSLRKLLQKIPIRKGVSLIMYVDETHTLAEKKPRSTETLYDLMVKAAANYCDHPFFIVFISTTSPRRALAPPAALSRSARWSDPALVLVPPFTEMPFDCHPEWHKRIQPGLKLEEVQRFSFMVRFGRPL